MSKYKENIEPKLFLIECWARDGLTDEQIANNVNVAYSTFREYKKKHEALSAALKKGKEVINYEVENSLLKKCLGCYVKEGRAFKCKEKYYDDEGRSCEREIVKTVEVDRFIPPDTTAIAIWLNNCKPEKWRRNYHKEKLDESKFEHEKDVDGKKYW